MLGIMLAEKLPIMLEAMTHIIAASSASNVMKYMYMQIPWLHVMAMALTGATTVCRLSRVDHEMNVKHSCSLKSTDIQLHHT